MSTIQSSAEHLTLNADGSSKDIKFQANGVEKASISSSGAFTSTTIDATKLTGTIPNFTSTGIDDNADATAITIDSSENVGIGVTPSAFHASYTGVNIGQTGTLFADTSGTDGLYIGSNAYYSTGNNYKYIVNGKACELKMDAGQSHFKFRTASSGTAGNAITWTDRLEITDDGRGLSQFTAKAWVNYNQDGNSIVDSHNISSATDTNTGNFVITLSNAMANTNYCPVTTAGGNSGSNGDESFNVILSDSTSTTTTTFRSRERDGSPNTTDNLINAIVWFGD